MAERVAAAGSAPAPHRKKSDPLPDLETPSKEELDFGASLSAFSSDGDESSSEDTDSEVEISGWKRPFRACSVEPAGVAKVSLGNFKENNMQFKIGSHAPSDLKSAAVPNFEKMKRIKPEDCLGRLGNRLYDPLALLHGSQAGAVVCALCGSRAADAAAIWWDRMKAEGMLPALDEELKARTVSCNGNEAQAPEHLAKMQTQLGLPMNLVTATLISYTRAVGLGAWPISGHLNDVNAVATERHYEWKAMLPETEKPDVSVKVAAEHGPMLVSRASCRERPRAGVLGEFLQDEERSLPEDAMTGQAAQSKNADPKYLGKRSTSPGNPDDKCESGTLTTPCGGSLRKRLAALWSWNLESTKPQNFDDHPSVPSTRLLHLSDGSALIAVLSKSELSSSKLDRVCRPAASFARAAFYQLMLWLTRSDQNPAGGSSKK